MAFVYILQSDLNKRFYIGSTVDLDRRLRDHQTGQTPTTRRMGSCRLVFSQEYPSLKAARAIERRLKALKRRDYIAKIIADGRIMMDP